MKCQTASAFLLCVSGGSAERRRQSDETAAKNKAGDACEWQWQGVFNCSIQRKRGRRNELCNPSEESEEAGKVRGENPVMTTQQLLTETGTELDTEHRGLIAMHADTRTWTDTCEKKKKLQEQAELQGSWKQTVKFVSLYVHQHSLWLRLFVLLPPFSFSLETKCALIHDSWCIWQVPFNPEKNTGFISVWKGDFSLMKQHQMATVHDVLKLRQKSPSLIHIWGRLTYELLNCTWLPVSFWDLLQGLPVGSNRDPTRCLFGVRAAERLPPSRHKQQDPMTPLPACLPAWEARLRQRRKHYSKHIAADKVNGFNCRDSQPNELEQVHTAGSWRE